MDPQAAGVDVGLAGAAERRDDGFGDRSVELRRGAVTRCGGVDRGIHSLEERSEPVGVGDVADDRGRTGRRGLLRGVRTAHRRDDVVTVGAQYVEDGRADVAGGTGEEDLHSVLVGTPPGGEGGLGKLVNPEIGCRALRMLAAGDGATGDPGCVRRREAERRCTTWW